MLKSTGNKVTYYGLEMKSISITRLKLYRMHLSLHSSIVFLEMKSISITRLKLDSSQNYEVFFGLEMKSISITRLKR